MRYGPWSQAVNRQLQAGVFLVVAAVAGIAGNYFNSASTSLPAVDLAARKLLLASFTDLDGKVRTLSPTRGKVLIVNFWATWCLPCREEIPELKKVHKKYSINGIEVTGIALDNVSKVRDFAADMSIDYGLLIANAEALVIGKDLGNQAGVLPFTVVLDRAGRVAYTHAGALTEATLDAVLAPLL
jgi:thiol-disulfide isomerase/thioredoxin